MTSPKSDKKLDLKVRRVHKLQTSVRGGVRLSGFSDNDPNPPPAFEPASVPTSTPTTGKTSTARTHSR
jgi:hypothetical protein